MLHEAALGSVPRSIEDPLATHAANATGFLNMLVAARDAGVRRFVYAASSSTYGDHPGLPKVEDAIGRPLSPYAVTKYVDELYADVFGRCYGMATVGLRYFNVFGPRQDPEGAYAAVIPRWVRAMLARRAGRDPRRRRDDARLLLRRQRRAGEPARRHGGRRDRTQVYNVAVGARDVVERALRRCSPSSCGNGIRGCASRRRGPRRFPSRRRPPFAGGHRGARGRTWATRRRTTSRSGLARVAAVVRASASPERVRRTSGRARDVRGA